jgi:thiamine pyrophosphokinase
MVKQVALIANGLLERSSDLLKEILSHDVIVAVDGGLNHCHQLGIVPNLIVGDLDSASPELLALYGRVETRRFPKDKDKTDFQIALEMVLNQENVRATGYGALGGRTDHALANIFLLSIYPGTFAISSSAETLFVVGRSVSLDCYPGQTLSLIPLNGPVRGINTEGLKWELSGGTMDKHFMGISNVCLNHRVRISVLEGDLLCCMTRL